MYLQKTGIVSLFFRKKYCGVSASPLKKRKTKNSNNKKIRDKIQSLNELADLPKEDRDFQKEDTKGDPKEDPNEARN